VGDPAERADAHRVYRNGEHVVVGDHRLLEARSSSL
jgi:hypothetical protein